MVSAEEPAMRIPHQLLRLCPVSSKKILTGSHLSILYFSESSVQQQAWSPYLCGQASSPCFFFVMAAP